MNIFCLLTTSCTLELGWAAYKIILFVNSEHNKVKIYISLNIIVLHGNVSTDSYLN